MTNILGEIRRMGLIARDKTRRYLDKISNNDYLSVLSVFFLFLLLNATIYFTVDNVSSSDDQWFYFKIAYLLRTEGWSAVTDFQGAYFSDLVQSGYSYAAGLYHYLLIPFTFFPNKIIGLKLSGLFFASVVPTLAYWVLRKFNLKNSLTWTVLFFYVIGSFNFTWRLFINRPFVLVDGLILAEIYLISKKKYWPFFLTTLVHVWWHPATFWLPLLLALCYGVVCALHEQKIDYKSIVLGLAGALGAFLLFPFHSHTFLSPINPVHFSKRLLAFVYGLGSGPKLIEGGENYKGDIFGMLMQSNLIFIVIIFLLVLSVVLYISRKRSGGSDLDSNHERVLLREYTFLVMLIMFLGFVFSRRFEDLLVPIVLLGSAISFQMLVENKYLRLENFTIKKVFIWSFFIFIIVTGGNRILDLRNGFGSDESFLRYERAGNWMKENTQKNDIIFNTDFGQFNRLFFYNSWNRYIIGIEPKNLYEHSQEHYWLWHNITLNGVAYSEGDYKEIGQKKAEGKNEEELKAIMTENAKKIAPVIKNKFKSQYIFFDQNSYLRKELERDVDDYSPVYDNKEDGIYIYKINSKE